MIRIEKTKKPRKEREFARCLGWDRNRAAAPEVVTVIVPGTLMGVPVAMTEEGLNVQAAPVGSPEQEKVMVPLKPVEAAVENVVEPEPPGADIPIPA